MNRFWDNLKHHFVPSHHNAYQPHVLRRSWLVFFLALTLIAEGFLATNLMMRQSSETYLAAVVPAEVVALTNGQRQQQGAGVLTQSSILDKAAQAKADDMVARGYFAHAGPDGKKPWDWMLSAGYVYRYAGENLAVRFVDSHDVVAAWMASPTHRANIVKPVYTQIGIGVAQGTYQGAPATYIVQFFATPLHPDRSLAAAASLSVGGNIFSTLWEKTLHVLGRLQAEPVGVTNSILMSIGVLLVVALLLTILVHTHVQPTQMIGAGATVLGVAVLLWVANTQLLAPPVGQSAAAVYGAGIGGGGVAVGQAGTTTEVLSE